MPGTLAVVEIPFAGPHTPSRRARLNPAERRFGDKSLLEWVVRRVTDSLLIDQVAILADAHQGGTILRLAPSDVAVVVSPQPESLSRLAAVARQFDAQNVVRLAFGSPFVDPQLIDRLICTANNHPGSDYIGYTSPRGHSVLNQLGLFGQWCSARAVYQADQEATDSEERSDSLRYVFTRPDTFRVRMISVPQQLDRHDLRLTINVEEDWDNAQAIFEALGPEHLDWQRIADLLDQQPALRQRMAVLNQADQPALAAG